MKPIEKVSRAIAAEMGEPLHGNSPGFRRLARAAIEALREPTPEMVKAAELHTIGTPRTPWQAMIDAALLDDNPFK